MKKIVLTTCLTTVLTIAYAGSGTHWGYSGAEGPENWAKLSPDYHACLGNNQSPVDLSGFIEADLEPLKINYKAGGNEIVNNGHTIQVNYDAGSSIQVDGQTFELKQFHFHSPSENHINGKSYPLEAHFVHANEKGDLAVVAVMFHQGADNKALDQAWSAIPQHAGDKEKLASSTDANAILPESKDYYRFNGSLTTPPCSEGVRWFVMKESSHASFRQIKTFSNVMQHANNRPIQATNARPILQ